MRIPRLVGISPERWAVGDAWREEGRAAFEAGLAALLLRLPGLEAGKLGLMVEVLGPLFGEGLIAHQRTPGAPMAGVGLHLPSATVLLGRPPHPATSLPPSPTRGEGIYHPSPLVGEGDPSGPDGGAVPAQRGCPAPTGTSALRGQSCHSREELQLAATHVCDYAFLSPIFSPLSKQDTRPVLGLDGLARLCRDTPLPVIALGGITAGRAAACLEAGASGVASIGALFAEPGPASVEKATRRMMEALASASA